MEIEQRDEAGRQVTALDRARAFSQALSDAARRARFSSRGRRAMSAGGFQARKGQTAQRWTIIISGILLVAIPSIISGVYFGFVAADQYVSEARFTVAGGEPPIADGLQLATGIPALAIVQDTQIVTNFIDSRAAVEQLDRMVNLRDAYSDKRADWYARFNPSLPIEKFVRYWQSMVDASIKLPSGIVEMQVRAFTPTDAVKISNAVLKISENLINDLNERMNRDAVANAQVEMDRATERLGKARAALEKARNDEGILDAEKAGELIGRLIEGARARYLQMEQEYNAQLRSVSADAPQMRAMKTQLSAVQGQIQNLESQLTVNGKGSAGAKTIATSMSKFAELDLEKQIAERLYASAATGLESSRLAAEHKLMYINAFVRPTIPEEPRYPRRMLSWIGVTASATILWLLCVGLGLIVRNHMA